MRKITEKQAVAPPHITVAQAAAIMNVSEKTIRSLIEYGVLESSNTTGKILIPRKQVETLSQLGR